MTKLEKYLSVTIVVILLCAFLLRKCNPEYINKEIIIKDTSTYELRSENARYDRIQAKYLNEKEKDEAEIERLTKLVASAKVIYRIKYIQVLKDSFLSDENCILTLESANEYISWQDSLIGKYSTNLFKCEVMNDTLNAQVKFNIKYSELSGKDEIGLIKELNKFKHWFWRLYWKRKK